MTPEDPPVWIDKADDFKRMVDDLAAHPLLAVDTESNSLFAYKERVCLIQFSTGEVDYLVDPLALRDISALRSIFASSFHEKIFHAAEYDLICLKRDFSFTFANIFDTMVAGRILGKTSIGLGSMLESQFNVKVDKRFQRANWGQRPLTPAQLAYARLDTFYLIPLRDQLKAELEVSGRWRLAQEDFVRLCNVSIPNGEHPVDCWWRVTGGQDLSAQQAAVLNELCKYRDEQARIADLPPFKVMRNQVMVEVAQSCPQSLDELGQIHGMSQLMVERYGKGIMEAIRCGMRSKPPPRPASHRPDDRFLSRLDALRDWRKQTGQKLGVESDVILPREILEDIAQNNPQKIEDLAVVMQPTPWRFERFGGQIFRVLHPPEET
jgi:ribonuclease D